MRFKATATIKRKLSSTATIKPKIKATALLTTENCPIVEEIDGGNAATIYIASKGNIDSGGA